jgi:hypothetical protein
VDSAPFELQSERQASPLFTSNSIFLIAQCSVVISAKSFIFSYFFLFQDMLHNPGLFSPLFTVFFSFFSPYSSGSYPVDTLVPILIMRYMYDGGSLSLYVSDNFFQNVDSSEPFPAVGSSSKRSFGSWRELWLFATAAVSPEPNPGHA